MRYGTTAGVTIAATLTVASWLVFPGAAAAPPVESRAPSPTVSSSTTVVPSTRAAAVRGEQARVSTTTIAPTLVDQSLGALNDVRDAVGLGRLAADPDLDALAQTWAVRLAADERLHHSSLIYEVIEGDDWTAAGENVGYGPSVGVLMDAFVASPTHEANIVNPRYRAVGIGIVVVDDVIWTAHLFAG
ncbi:MAG: hypothetical protein DHS20C19_06950 [Acidimicrobiales bacterium]|nr:MAG: hypothetical protein DHS20C19_06950 [Acidimicrobiales bacterium]